MEDVTVVDSYGRRTVFKGELLVTETTDNGDKPQWLDIDIWRTEGGSYVVRKDIQYRVVHASRNCSRLEGYASRKPDEEDTILCRVCNPEGTPVAGGWAQEARMTVDVIRTPGELIESLKVKGDWTRLSRTLLAEVSTKDPAVDTLWNTVVVD